MFYTYVPVGTIHEELALPSCAMFLSLPFFCHRMSLGRTETDVLGTEIKELQNFFVRFVTRIEILSVSLHRESSWTVCRWPVGAEFHLC